ncbi:hypothetical protein DOT37_03750 [Pantoea agglomerans]|nr:hypothetical protein [Pantoea agglomerans]RAH33360.1 hypothetical protein DOT37_03750 [Pantoea agglomerans]TGX93595.1 hypothetical protein E5821_03740 [Pantoea agglomerans]
MPPGGKGAPCCYLTKTCYLVNSDCYNRKQQNFSAGGSFTFGSMTGSASVNLSQDKMHSNWQSVAEQTGIFAGKGGFDVTAGEHTQLNGAVISSTATADKNCFDTGTLGFSKIENHAYYKTEHQSMGMSTSGSIASQLESNAFWENTGVIFPNAFIVFRGGVNRTVT